MTHRLNSRWCGCVDSRHKKEIVKGTFFFQISLHLAASDLEEVELLLVEVAVLVELLLLLMDLDDLE